MLYISLSIRIRTTKSEVPEASPTDLVRVSNSSSHTCMIYDLKSFNPPKLEFTAYHRLMVVGAPNLVTDYAA